MGSRCPQRRRDALGHCADGAPGARLGDGAAGRLGAPGSAWFPGRVAFL